MEQVEEGKSDNYLGSCVTEVEEKQVSGMSAAGNKLRTPTVDVLEVHEDCKQQSVCQGMTGSLNSCAHTSSISYSLKSAGRRRR